MGRLQDSFKAYITDDADVVASDIALDKVAYGPSGRVVGSSTGSGIQLVSWSGVNYTAMPSTPTTYTIPKPANVIAGDWVLLLTATRNSALTGYATGFTGVQHSGVLISSLETPPSTTNEELRIQHKVLTGSEGATFDIEATDDGTDWFCALAVAFRGVSSFAFSSIAGGISASPSMTAAVNDVLLSVIGTVFDASTLNNQHWPSEMALAAMTYASGGDMGHAVAMETIRSAGATGTRTWSGAWGDYEWAFSVLLTP